MQAPSSPPSWKNQIVGKGAKFVVVVNLPNVAWTPSGLAAEAAAPGSKALTESAVKPSMPSFPRAWNGRRVLYIDAYAQGGPRQLAAYGLTNITTPACSSTSPLNLLPGYRWT